MRKHLFKVILIALGVAACCMLCACRSSLRINEDGWHFLRIDMDKEYEYKGYDINRHDDGASVVIFFKNKERKEISGEK